MTAHTAEFKNLEQKISNLTTPIEKVDFDIYLEIFKDEWQEILDIFQQDVVEVDQRLKILIIKTFSQIKSIKEGVEVVQNLSQIQTRPTVHESVPYICNKIIAHFVKEINLTDKLFEKNKQNRANVKIYDSITWANDLAKNLQTTTQSLQNVDSLSTLPNFPEVIELLDNFTSKTRTYTKAIFKEWCGMAIILIKDTLKENIIEIEEAEKSVDLNNLSEIPKVRRNPIANGKNPFPILNPASGKDMGIGALSITLKWIARSKIMAENALKKQRLEILKQLEQAHKVSWLEFVGDSLLIEKGFRFKMKFQSDIFEILKESENLQNSGFNLPDEICQLLTIKDDLYTNTNKIKYVLSEYNDIIDKLPPAKILLVKTYLKKMEMAIQPGLGLYTWKSTVLENYVKNITSKLEELICLLYQINEIFKKLDHNISSIESLNFLPVKNITTENITCEDFFRELDDLQKKEASECLNIYHTISMRLIQAESLILLTNTGKSDLMINYYESYSEKIAIVLIKSVLNSISDLNHLVWGQLPTHFNIKVFLENNEIKLNPTCAELFQYMKIGLTRMFSRLKCLRQWESGSCVAGAHSAKIFYVKIILDEDIKLKCEQLLQSIQNFCTALKTYTTRWLGYSILWKYNKQITIKQFADDNPQLSDYEMRFDFYSNVASKIEQEKLIVNVLCVNIETSQLIEQLKNHCFEWKSNLGTQLTLDTRICLNQVSEKIRILNSSLRNEIKNEQDLTEILRTINEIQEIAFDMELKFYKIEEHYHELIMQNFTVSESDEQRFHEVKADWQELYDKSLYKQCCLEEAKNIMTDPMKQKILNFIKECQEFADEYTKDKSTFESSDFDTTVKLIVNYSKKCSELYEEKKSLETVQSCYEVAPFDFKFFETIKEELEVLRNEYKLQFEN